MDQHMTEPGPLFSVVRGQPSDEETAALAVVVTALAARASAGRQGSAAAKAPGNWAGHARALRVQPAPAAGAWRRSALPR
jgi:Acyl-CoA carboxylase epsilon subunit